MWIVTRRSQTPSPARDWGQEWLKIDGTMGVSIVDQINQSMAEAVEAQEAGNYAAALRKAEAAWMRLCGLPDSEFENERLEWSREGLERLLTWLKKRVNDTAVDPGTGGRGSIIRPAQIVYKRG